MAIPLESTIMREIGLGNHYTWYGGTSTCSFIRKKAANQLSEVIKKYHGAGESIALPDKDLINVLSEIAEFGEESEYTLMKTWQAASYVIAEHIHQAKATEQDRNKAYEGLKQYLKKEFLPESRERLDDCGIMYNWKEE